MTQALYFSPRITLTLRGLLWFCTNFIIICFRSVKNNEYFYMICHYHPHFPVVFLVILYSFLLFIFLFMVS